MTGIDSGSYLPAMLFVSEGPEERRVAGPIIYEQLCDKHFWSTEGYHWLNELANQPFISQWDEQVNVQNWTYT